MILTKRVGFLSPFKFLFLVKGITTIIMGFMERVLPHHCWTAHRDVCKTSDNV
jgi:hypothetical protein